MFARLIDGQVGGGERAGDCHVNGQTLAVAPKRDEDIAGAATGSRAEDALLLQDRAEQPLAGDVVDEVAEAVVAGDEVA